MFDLAPAAVEIFLAFSGLAILMVGAFQPERADSSRLVDWLVVMVMVAGILALMLTEPTSVSTFAGHFVTDAFASFLKIFVLLGAALCLIMGASFMERAGIHRFEYAVLALFSTLGMLMMISANSLISLYLALEMQSLPIYVMTAFHRDQTRSTEAGLKYFVLGALASGLLLYGCSLVYGFTGTLSFDGLARVFQPGPSGEVVAGTGALVGLVFVAAGLAFKLAAVPFHMWTPDVYEGAPTPVTAFIAAAPKVAAMGLAVRLFYQPFGAWVEAWQQIVVFISVASMLLGAFAAIGQTNIKRLLAYSSIGHIGYAMVGLAAGTPQGAHSVLIYITIYMIMTVGAFACVLAMRRHGAPVETIDDLSGLGRQQPLFAAAIAIFMFSLAGIPPLAGFFAKFYVFMAAIEADLVPLAVIGVLASVVGAYYYIRIVKVMYFDDTQQAIDRPIPRELELVVGATALFNLLFCIAPTPLLRQAQLAAAALVS